jgi:membrane associated rhomboid family serine protease
MLLNCCAIGRYAEHETASNIYSTLRELRRDRGPQILNLLVCLFVHAAILHAVTNTVVEQG